MYSPIEVEPVLAVVELDSIMDSPTALHCADCGETLTPDGLCLNVGTCLTAGRQASRGGATRKFDAPRAWTLGGRVD